MSKEKDDIIFEKKEKQIGSVYVDEWSQGLVRFHKNKEEKQELIQRNELEERIRQEGWIIEKVSKASDSYEKVYEEIITPLCSHCQQTAMFDTDKTEFYCAVCD